MILVDLVVQKAEDAALERDEVWLEDHVHRAWPGDIDLDLGLLSGRVHHLIKTQAYRQFFMHRTGHWLGLDVHDVGDYKVAEHWRLLEPGMVMTIEPGIYVSPANKDVAKRWRGIGIRIEDDVLVTREGPEVLTADLAASVEEIEALMATRA